MDHTAAEGTPPFAVLDTSQQGTSPPDHDSLGVPPMAVFGISQQCSMCRAAADAAAAAAAASGFNDDDDEGEEATTIQTPPPSKRQRQSAEETEEDRAVNAAVEALLRDVQRRRTRDHPGRRSEGPAQGELCRWLGTVHDRMGGAGEALHLVDLRQVTIDGETNQRRRGFLAGAGVRRWLAEHCDGQQIPAAPQVVVAVAALKKTTARLVADGEDGCKRLAVLRHRTARGRDAWSHLCTVTIDGAPVD